MNVGISFYEIEKSIFPTGFLKQLFFYFTRHTEEMKSLLLSSTYTKSLIIREMGEV